MKRLWTPILAGAAVCGAMFAHLAPQASAQTAAVASGDWSDPATWSPAEPVAGDLAAIDGGLTVDVTQAGEVANILHLGTIASQAGNLSVDAPGELTVGTVVRVGQIAGATGNLTMTGGTVTVNGAPGSGIGDGELLVGDAGSTGTVTMSGGLLQTADEIFIGLGAGSNGTVNVSGGTFQTGRNGFVPPPNTPNGRSIIVGFDGGTGELNVSGAGDVNANFDLLVGLGNGSNGTVTLSSGTIDAGFVFTNAFTGGADSSTSTMTQTGGTLTTRIAYVLGQGNGTSTGNHSGGTIDVINNGEFVVGDGGGNSSTYNISGTADVNVARNLVAGRDGTGVVNMTGGTIDTANVVLGDFDTSSGTMRISGGTLTLTGNFNVGAALASNAVPERVEPDGTNGPQGQALDANGTLVVSGNGATIDVGGNFLANPDDKSSFRRDPFAPGGDNSATLAFEIFDSSGTSLIDIAGIADLDGAVIDLDLMGGYSPALGQTFDLLTAASFGATGTGTTQNVGTGRGYELAAEDAGRFSLAIVAGGNGEILRATAIPEPATCGLAAVAALGLAACRRKRA